MTWLARRAAAEDAAVHNARSRHDAVPRSRYPAVVNVCASAQLSLTYLGEST